MKKTIWLSPLIIACLAGAASAQDEIELVESYMVPSALDGQNGRAGNMQAEAAGILAKFNAAQGGAWKAAVDSKSGQVRVLYGGNSKRYGDRPEDTAKGFLRDSSEVFGLRSDLADMKILSADTTPERDHISFQQMYDGVPVSGAALLVHATKEGQVTMAQNNYIKELKPVNSRQISEAEAVSKVMEDLKAAATAETVFSQARAEELIVPVGDKYYFAWKVTVSSKNPFAFWVYHVDAENSSFLYKENEIVSMRNGVGRVYKNNNDWMQNKFSKVVLKQLFTESDGYMSGGLWGKHADVYDDESDSYGDDPYAPNLKFLYYPYGREKPWFDAVTTYYMVNTVWTWWNSNVVKKYGPKNITYFHTLSIPVGIGVDMCNAYYTPELLPDYPPGFVFGNEDACVEGSEDFALDEDVVMHEFTHAMMEWSHFDRQFGGVVNGYGRAMGEGNADWFAYLRTKDSVIAEVALAWSSEGYLRNIDNTRMYPADAEDPSYGPEYKNEKGETVIVHHLPEEHYTGEIWGGYLYDLSQVLGLTKALQYVYRGNYYFSPAGGFKRSAADFYDAINAQRLAEQDLTGKLTNTIKAWGSMSSRGLLGSIRSSYKSDCYFPASFPVCTKDKVSGLIICEPCSAGSDAEAYFVFKLSGGSSLSTQGRFLSFNVCNEYPVELGSSGLQLNVKVTGSGTSPSITLYNSSKAVVAGPTSGTANEAALNVTGKPSGIYSIMICGAAAGKYQIQISTAQ